MRINVYSQELTSEVATVEKVSNTGLVYSAVQLMLHSSPMLHHPPQDDDRSAVTFWLPKSEDRREALAAAFEEMAAKVRAARPETGLDDFKGIHALLSEREKTKGAMEALAAAVRWRQAQIERGILNMTDDELTEARAAQDKAMAALSTLTQEKTNVG